MTRSQRMQPVQRVAEDRADAAAKVYAEARKRLEEQRARLQQLIQYRQDYLNQRAANNGGAMDGFRLRDYNAFIARIDTAIQHQQQAVAVAEGEAQRTRRLWTDVLGRARAIEKVVERYQDDERREDNRREQRLSDELATRLPRPAPSDDE